ncbi:MAG: hypothetical protein C4581_04115 [Nitrospiraceae bacterium]|nr:MAG: hypothetical protein C4581_04115 [Nitrospiraceae bacterium]
MRMCKIKKEKEMNKKRLMYVLLGVMMMALLLGCSKKPEAELADSKAVLEAVAAEGGEKYAKEELDVIQSEMTAALDEMAVQDGKFFKNYDKTKEMLAQVKAKSEALKAEIPARKEKARTDAQAALDAATMAVTDAKALLAKAPRGKGSMADIEAFNADVQGLESAITEAQGLMTSEDYFVALDKANGIKDKASEISTQVTEALEKVKASKKR